MITMVVMILGHFMTVYRLCKVLRKGYTAICEAYSEGMRDLLRAAVDDPNKQWDDQLMGYLDKAFNYHPQKTIPRV